MYKSAFEELGVSDLHSVASGKSETHLIESVNSSIRDNLARFNRKSKRYSKCEKMLRDTLLLFFHENNPVSVWNKQCFSKGKEHKSDSFYVSNLRNKNACYISECVRFHWHIENKFHYPKDVVMREDASSTKNINAAANLALFRNFVFNILKQTDKSIKCATETFSNYTVRKILNILMNL